MDEFSEDLPGARLPDVVEAYFARERAWHRLLRGTGLVTPEEAREQLARWTR
ncbi:hypothetical protein [Mycolicibacterium llatzerense]|uniref:hypothetical protein n=1 Tax=Mycolicibacterium llatzerense TaxID=280871 RepID=UPI0013A6CF56|nr:hypothetical protein [Mycolicibacterium llatzerense]